MTQLSDEQLLQLLIKPQQAKKKTQPQEALSDDQLLSMLKTNSPKKDLGTLPAMKFEANIGKPSATKSFILGAVNNVGGGINQLVSGAKDIGSGALNRLLGSNINTDRYKTVTQQTKAVDDAYERSRSNSGQTGTDWWREGGAVAASIPIMSGGLGKSVFTTIAKSGGLGALVGGAQFAESADKRKSNIKTGAIGGAIGGAAGKGLEKIASRSTTKIAENATRKSVDAPRNTLTKDARSAGYIIPPSYSNPTVWNKSLAKIAGEADLGKIASGKNQEITNSLARKAVGIADDQPITPEALGHVRQEAGKAYEIVNNLGRVKVDQRYLDDYKKIIEPYLKLADDFNLEVSNDVIKTLQQASPKNGAFEASSALHAIRSLREQASKAYKAGDTELGKATRSLSTAFEAQLERALVKNTKIPREAIHNYTNARKIIAKTHSIEDALNEVGDVSAMKLASMLGRGAPFEGELKQVAKFGSVYPQLNNVGRHGGAGVTFADAVIGAGGAMVDPSGIGLMVARPTLRHGLASSAAGKISGNQSYNSNLLKALEKAGILTPVAPVVGVNTSVD